MKILVIGLESATPEILFTDERLTNFRRLMEGGCYGRLETVVPTTPVPSWMCMATSQDPGSLGVYGFRNRADYSYHNLTTVTSEAIEGRAIWDQVAREGKRSNIKGVPPSYQLNVMQEVPGFTGGFPSDVRGFRTSNSGSLKDEVYTMSRKYFDFVRHQMQHAEWDYFQFVETGLDRLHHGFFRDGDPENRQYQSGKLDEETIRGYYLYLDEELGKIFEVMDEDTAILVMSCYGAQKLKDDFCMNKWLVQEGLLVLNQYPQEITPFAKLDVNWEQTRAWSEGGDCAQIFFNVEGREHRGTIAAADYETFRNEIHAKLEATLDDGGEPLGMRAIKPQEVYRETRNVPPDLIVQFGGLSWRTLTSADYAGLRGEGWDGCGPAGFGSFILAASNNPLSGEIDGAHLLDMAPTLLELGGYDIPSSMQGKSLVAGKSLEGDGSAISSDEEELLRQRLSGLGYIA
jgi:predicted AlkP superfamily phosphohydrolase/phosphomutase